MGIVSLLLIIAAGCTGIAGVIKAINGMKKDDSPHLGTGFFDAFKAMFKDQD